uniref:Uncharacterized protein n=1 Tax=Quercus lobata TaxID=97700 RepID=A0A7N2LR98_QUELO
MSRSGVMSVCAKVGAAAAALFSANRRPGGGGTSSSSGYIAHCQLTFEAYEFIVWRALREAAMAALNESQIFLTFCPCLAVPYTLWCVNKTTGYDCNNYFKRREECRDFKRSLQKDVVLQWLAWGKIFIVVDLINRG